MIRLLIADDHEVLRWGLKWVLSSQRDMEVVAEAADGEAAVVAARETVPDVVLLDLSMPRGGGWAALSAILSERPDARVVVVTAADGAQTAKAARQAGAAGFVSKASGDEALLRVIRNVAPAARLA